MSYLAGSSDPAPEVDPSHGGDGSRPLLSEARALLLILCALGFGLVMRIAAASQMAALPLFDAPTAEAAAALQRAQEIAGGGVLPLRPLDGGAIYPYVLAGLLAIPGAGFTAVVLAQASAGIVTVALLALTAGRLYGAAAGVATAALGALYGPFAFLEADALDAAWVQLAIAGALWALVAWSGVRTRGARFTLLPAAAALALGLATLQRPHLAMLIPLAVAWVAVRARAPWLAVGTLAVALVPAAVAVSLATHSGSFAVTRGADLYAGNHAGARGTPAEPWTRPAREFSARPGDVRASAHVVAEANMKRTLTHEQASAYWEARTSAFLREHPGEAAALIVRKAALAFAAAEIPSDLDFSFVRERAWALGALPVGFGAVLPLAAIGIGFAFVERRRRAEALLLALCALAVVVGMIPFFVSERLRAPMVLPLLVAAGGGIVALIRSAANPDVGREPRLRAVVIVACACIALSIFPDAGDNRARDWWWFARALEQRGDLPAVASAYEAAADAGGNPRTRALVLERLALTYETMELPDLAVRTLRQAIQADPEHPGPHRHLGVLFAAHNDPARALTELREAVRLGGADAELFGVIAALLAFQGKNAEAAEFYARAVALAPADARLAQLARDHPELAGGEPTTR